jgi:hypothetical protein
MWKYNENIYYKITNESKFQNTSKIQLISFNFDLEHIKRAIAVYPSNINHREYV